MAYWVGGLIGLAYWVGILGLLVIWVGRLCWLIVVSRLGFGLGFWVSRLD